MNVLTWYKNRMKEVVSEGGYVNTASIRLIVSEGSKNGNERALYQF